MKLLNKTPLSIPSEAASSPSYSTEVKLLCCCARTSLDSKTTDKIQKLLQTDLNWKYLLQIASQHGVIPLLNRSLSAIPSAAIPQEVRERLRNHFRANTRHNLFLTGELLKLLKLLEAKGIPAIAYKGPILAAGVYGDLSFREFVDLDLLIHRQDLPKAKDLFIAWGYQPYFPTTSPEEDAYLQALTGTQAKAFLESQWEHHFVRADGRVNVDLHQEIMPQSFALPFNTEGLWERREPLSVAGQEILSFSPEDLLLLLCAHGAKDCWQRLDRICDVAQLIRTQPQLNWEQVLAQARQLGALRILLLGVHLAQEWLEAPLPTPMIAKIQADLKVISLGKVVGDRLFPKASSLTTLSKAQEFTFHLQLREQLQDKIRYWFYHAMTPTVGDWAALELPMSLHWLYYLLRPLRLLRTGLAGRDNR